MSLHPGRLYGFGPFRLDTVSRRLLRDGQIVELTPKVFDILVALVENRGRTIGKDELMSTVWADTFVEEGNLTQNISILRKALAGGSDLDYIETIPKQGYRFVAPVETIAGPLPEAQARPRSPILRFRWAIAFTVALAILFAVLALWKSRARGDFTPVRALAVLPLENFSGDASQDYLADSMTERDSPAKCTNRLRPVARSN